MLTLPVLKIESTVGSLKQTFTNTFIILPVDHPILVWSKEDFIKYSVNRKDFDFITHITKETANILQVSEKYIGCIVVAMTSHNPYINNKTWTENTFRTVAEANMKVFKEVYEKLEESNKIKISSELREKLEQEEDW